MNNDALALLLKSFRLGTMAAIYEGTLQQAEQQNWGYRKFLLHLCESEAQDRRQRKLERLLKQSGLPQGKDLGSLEETKLPAKVRRMLPSLLDGGFVQRAENVIAIGLPGRGKSHFLAALGRELILRHHYAVLFVPTFKLVQQLLTAKRDLRLEERLRELDQFDAIILDDVGYVKQERDEMEVLFTFLAERYERRSVMISSNLVFSKWDQIFKDPMTTMAAVDRLVHHAILLEFQGESLDEELRNTVANVYYRLSHIRLESNQEFAFPHMISMEGDLAKGWGKFAEEKAFVEVGAKYLPAMLKDLRDSRTRGDSVSYAQCREALLYTFKFRIPDWPSKSVETLRREKAAYAAKVDELPNLWRLFTTDPASTPPSVQELPSWADWAVNLFSKMGQLRKIEIELTTDKLVNERGETVGGIAFLRRGNRPAKAKINFTELASCAYPFFYIYIDDLKSSPRKDDNRAVTHWLEVTANSPEFEASNHARATYGKAALSPEEFLSQYSAEKFERESINRNYKPSALKDVGAALKSRWGKPTMDDMSRLFQNWFFRNPPT